MSVLLWALLVVGGALFLVRGTWKAIDGGNYDLVLIYSSARAWLHGTNPYEREAVRDAWLSSGGPAERDPMIPRGPATLVYPPPAMAVLAPIAAMPWRAASVVWAIGNTGLAAASLLALGAVAGLGRTGRLAVVSLGMCMAPLVTNTALGQTAIVVLACTCGGTLARVRGKSILAGACLGLGAALKPQLGLLFVVYEAGRMRWRVAGAAGAAIVLLSGVGIGRMEAAGVNWLGSWRRNVHEFTTIDDANASRSNALRHQVVNLHYPLHNFTDDKAVVRGMVYGICGGLCLAYFLVDRRRPEPADELVSLSFVSVVTLMVAYHRYYDAAILIIPLALAVRGIARGWDRGQRAHLATLVLVLVFALPLPVILMESARRGWISQAVVSSRFGEYLVLPLQALMLVVLNVWLIIVRGTGGPPPSAPIMQRST